MTANAHRFANPKPPRPRVPPEIKLALASRQDNTLPRIAKIVGDMAAKVREAGDPAQWLANLQTYLADGDRMVVHARMGRTLVGFLVLDSDIGAAPFSWVDERFRHRGLGERFYSFACINLARPTPEFKFPADMIEEYGGVFRDAGLQPTLRDSFYVLHENGGAVAGDTTNENVPATKPKSEGPRRLVIEDGQWVGFSHHDARRLKIRYGRTARNGAE